MKKNLNNNLKIIYFHQYFTTPKGSGGTRSYSIAKELVENGHHVKVVCLKDIRSDNGLKGDFKNGIRIGVVEGIEIVEINIPYSNNLNLVKRSIAFIKYSFVCSFIAIKEDCDLIFATSTPLTASIPGIVGKIFRGRKFIFEVRDLWPELPVALGIIKNPILIKLLSILEKIAYISADKCIGLAPGICSGIEKRGINKKNIHLLPNASDINIFMPPKSFQEKNPIVLSSIIKIKKIDYFIAAFTGAHGVANGLNILIDVAIELKKRGRDDIYLLFIGEGKCKKELEEKVKIEGIKNCIFFPSIPKIKLAKILKENVHVGMMVLKNIPAFYNGTSPNKFFDYLASGLPIINNYPGWISKLIKKYNLGIKVKPDDFKDFADALISLADNKELLQQQSINARRLAEVKFSTHILSRKMREIIENLFLEKS